MNKDNKETEGRKEGRKEGRGGGVKVKEKGETR